MRNRSGFGWVELLIGIFLVALGIFTLVRPNSTLTAAVILYGLIALGTGIADIIFYVKAEEHLGFAPTLALISGILSVLTGVILLVYPGAGKLALAIFFPIWFISHCISRLSQLPLIRIHTGKVHYYFVLIVNIIGLILGCLMLIRPAAALLSLNLIVCVYLILLGIDSIVLAFSNVGSRW